MFLETPLIVSVPLAIKPLAVGEMADDANRMVGYRSASRKSAALACRFLSQRPVLIVLTSTVTSKREFFRYAVSNSMTPCNPDSVPETPFVQIVRAHV